MNKCEVTIAKETVGIFSPLFVTDKLTAVTALEREELLHSVTSQRDDFQNHVHFGASEREGWNFLSLFIFLLLNVTQRRIISLYFCFCFFFYLQL